MKNTEIKYKLSTDYNRLYDLLLNGNIIIGFIQITIDNKPYKDYSKLIQMQYEPTSEFFDIGISFSKNDFNISDFIKICEKENIRYIDID